MRLFAFMLIVLAVLLIAGYVTAMRSAPVPAFII